MDIQVVDEADLPIKAVFPKKSIFTMIGFIVGLLISIIYSYKKYTRAYKYVKKME